MRKERRLISLRRPVAPPRLERYSALWSELHREATARGAHAWRFTSLAEPDLFLEFLEFDAQADPRAAPAVGDLLQRLDEEGGRAVTEEWREG